MVKNSAQKYDLLFDFFSLKEIAVFLCEIGKTNENNYIINENIASFAMINTKTDGKTKKNLSFSDGTIKILQIINHFRENQYLSGIFRFLQYRLQLKLDKNIKHDGKKNCGITVVKNGKKLDLSLDSYLDQLQRHILNNMDGENYGK